MSAHPVRRAPALLLLLAITLSGCGGSQIASRQRTRYTVRHGVLPQPSEIRVAEYLADYPEDLPDPAPRALGLTVEAARAAWASHDSEPLLVVQTAVRGRSADVRPPVALMFVVDRSGSMASQDKMSFVRQGLHRLVDQLDPRDTVGIVAFDDRAELLLPLTRVGESAHLHHAIDRLQPRGGTNLSEGVRAGYEQLRDHRLGRMLRRVVLLTDAMANVGETDMRYIADWAASGDEHGVRLSAVGVGLEYDDATLVEMARRGRGNHYFLDSPREIERVFRTEVNGLLEDVADRVRLTFTPRPGVEVVRVEGADSLEGQHAVDLGRLGAGEHRVVLWTLRGVDPSTFRPDVGTFTLDFADMRTMEVLRQSDDRPVFVVEGAEEGTVARNAAVAWMARDLRVITELAQRGRHVEASERLERVRVVMRGVRFSRPNDPELGRDVEMLRDFAHTLAQYAGGAGYELWAPVMVRVAS